MNNTSSGAPPTIARWTKLVNSKGVPSAWKVGDPAQCRRHEADDLLQMLTILDVNKVELPKFVAEDLDRIPGAVMVNDTAATSLSGSATEFTTPMNTFALKMRHFKQCYCCT